MRVRTKKILSAGAVGVTAVGVAFLAGPALAETETNLRPTIRLVNGTCGGRSVLSWQFWDDHTPRERLSYAIVHNSNPGLFENTPWWVAGVQHRMTFNLPPAGVQGKSDMVIAVTDAEGNTRRWPFTVRVGYTTMTGTDLPDLIIGRSGPGQLNGGGGPDVMCGGTGDDTINGGDGDDFLYGQAGSDHLTGGDGNDILSDTQGGDDTLDGGPGADRMWAGKGGDTVNGGDGNDRADAGTGDDTMTGDGGADLLIGGTGSDQLDGGPGTDDLYANTGVDYATGGPDADAFWLGGGGRAVDFTPGQGDTATNPGSIPEV